MCLFAPKQLSSSLVDTNWVSYSLSQFSHHLAGDSIRCHRSGLSPTRLLLLQMPITNPGCHLGLWPTGYKSDFHHPLLEFSYLVEWLTELRKTLYLFLPIYYKGYFKVYKWTARWKRRIGQGLWEGVQSFHAPASWAALPTSQKLSKTHRLGFLWRLCYVGMRLNHWPLAIDSISSPSPLPSGWCWKFQPSNHLVLWATSPHPVVIPGVSKSQVIYTNSGGVERGLLWVTKDSHFHGSSIKKVQGFRSCVPGRRMKTKYTFLINHNITDPFCQFLPFEWRV